MNKGIYIATLEPNSGKSIVSLGLMRTLLGKTAKVGYFRPIIDDSKNTGKDNHISTVLSFFDIKHQNIELLFRLYAFCTVSRTIKLFHQRYQVCVAQEIVCF